MREGGRKRGREGGKEGGREGEKERGRGGERAGVSEEERGGERVFLLIQDTDGSQGTVVGPRETDRGSITDEEETHHERVMEGREGEKETDSVMIPLSWKISTMANISDSSTHTLLCDMVVVVAYYVVFYYAAYLVCS